MFLRLFFKLINFLVKSIFTSFLYCGDCGHKLWFNFNQKNPSIRFFSCSNYKGMRGTCENTHYIREDALEQIVLMELRMLAEFLESAEDDFAELLEQKTNKDMIREKTTAEGALATAKARSKKLIGLFQKLYEDNVEGKVTDEWFMQLSNKYEAEQEELKRQMFELQEKLDKIEQMRTAKDDFLRAIHKFMLIEQSNLTISAIMEQLGFFDSAHFSKLFKARTGYSPKEFRIKNGYRSANKTLGDKTI